MDINIAAGTFMKKTLYLWLPFFALILLYREIKKRRQAKP
jgi:hypothetical protein